MKKFPSARFNSESEDHGVCRNSSFRDDNGAGQHPRAVLDLYEDYKRHFEVRNFLKIEKIIISIMNTQQDSPILHIIHGETFLFRGNCEKSHFHLAKYINTAKEVDAYALNVIAMWNESAGYHALALAQYVECLAHSSDLKTLARILFNAITNKKRQRFFDTSMAYYRRLLAVPEGYRLFPCVQIEIIHIYILKKNYQMALDAIHVFLCLSSCIFIKRLKAYIHYVTKNYIEVLKHKNDAPLDPYLSYLVGRIGKENLNLEIDVPHYFDEAIKSAGDSPYIYNSYGNYYFMISRYSDAAEQYSNALATDPHFQPAIDNMNLITKAGFSSPDHPIYIANVSRCSETLLSEADPDVEETGFLNIWKMFGYLPFKRDRKCYQKLVPFKRTVHLV